jgi:hypothetical protein
MDIFAIGTHDFDTTMTRRVAGFALVPTRAAAIRIHRQFFDFVQNLTDFMQAVGRVERLVSPVLRR